jgi:peptide chain release factor subunit 1
MSGRIFSPDLDYGNGVVIYPPKKITISKYICGKSFDLDYLLEMYKEEKIYGCSIITGELCKNYKITKSGTYIGYQQLDKLSTKLQKKQKKGGQSSVRIARIGLEKRELYKDKIVDNIINSYLVDNKTKCIVSVLILAGNASLKSEIANDERIKQFFTIPIIILDTESINVAEIYERAKLDILRIDEIDSFTVVEEITDLMRTNDERLLYGIDEVMNGLENYEVEKVIYNIRIPDDQKRLLNGFDIRCIEIMDGIIDIPIIGVKYW